MDNQNLGFLKNKEKKKYKLLIIEPNLKKERKENGYFDSKNKNDNMIN